MEKDGEEDNFSFFMAGFWQKSFFGCNKLSAGTNGVVQVFIISFTIGS